MIRAGLVTALGLRALSGGIQDQTFTVEDKLVVGRADDCDLTIADPRLSRHHARFHLADWDASILRKLETLESIYQKMSDFAGTRRMELLEWIIIVLITLSIVLPFLWGGHP